MLLRLTPASRAVAFGAFLCGCYASHGIASPDAMLDAGRDAASDAERDAPMFDVPRDAPSDTPSDVARDAASCALDPEDRAETVCTVTTTGDFPAEAPFALTVRWSACRCDTGRSCAVTVDGVIDVRADSCVAEEVCDDCTFESLCPVPALASGTYRLRVNGRDAYDVLARPEPVSRTRRPRCYEIPAVIDDPDVGACSFAWDARVTPGRLCHHAVEDVGTYVRFVYAATCRSCTDVSAGCSVERTEERLIVRPHVQACDACPGCACTEMCSETTVECRSTALRDGTYQVFVEDESGMRSAGIIEVRDVAGPGPEQCVDL